MGPEEFEELLKKKAREQEGKPPLSLCPRGGVSPEDAKSFEKLTKPPPIQLDTSTVLLPRLDPAYDQQYTVKCPSCGKEFNKPCSYCSCGTGRFVKRRLVDLPWNKQKLITRLVKAEA